MSNLPSFDLPDLLVNQSGWGPPLNSENQAFQRFDGMPFQLFNKCDRVGRIVDWLGVERIYKKNDTRDRYNERMYGSSATAGTQFVYVHNNEDSNFQLVDAGKQQKQPRPYRRAFAFRKIMQQQRDDRREAAFAQSNRLKKSVVKEQMRALKQWKRRGMARNNFPRNAYGRRYGDRQSGKTRQPSVQVRADWKVLEELDFQRLTKLTLPNVEAGQDIKGHSYGTMHFYDKSIDKVSVKTQIPLQKCGGTFSNLSTTEDPVIGQLAQAGVGNVFATDIILASLMSATRSVNSWDIVVTRLGDKLFFDKRDSEGLFNPIDALTVSETAVEPPSTDTPGINNANDLATEALFINQNFRRQVLKRNEAPYKFEHDRVPFEDETSETKLECGYRYRTWNLGTMTNGTPINVVARTETDGVLLGPSGEVQKLTIKAFNEWDCSAGGVDWRSKLDTQKGAIVATEMKNNSYKLAKFALQSLLAGSDYIKFGYVSRVNVRNSAQHVILGTQQFRPTEFATSISLNLDNCWGILRTVIDFFLKQPNGKYLMLKDPLQQVVRIYALPEGTFDSSDEDNSDDDSDSDGDDN